MPKIGTIFDMKPEKDYKRKCNEDGTCSGCGECCSDFLPLSDSEIARIKRYVKKHQLKPHNNMYALMQDGLDMTCPFRSNTERKCDIYAIRPEICRQFICSKSLEDAKNDRDLLYENRTAYSMRSLFFGDTKTVDYLMRVMREINGVMFGGAMNGKVHRSL